MAECTELLRVVEDGLLSPLGYLFYSILSLTGQSALRFLREGAHGYMTKERAGEELIGALRTVHAGRRYASPALLEKLAAS